MERNTKLLMSVLLVVGMVVGCGGKGGKAVARVGDRTVTVDELNEAMQKRPARFGNPDAEFQQRLEQVERMVEHELLVIGGYDHELDMDTTILQRVEAQRQRFLLDLLYEREILDKAKATDDEVREFYDRTAEEVKAAHILIEDEVLARSVLDSIKAGADFSEMAARYSKDPTGASGGELGWFTWGQMVDPFQSATFALDPGELSEPVQTRYGWHIILLQARRPIEGRPDFEQAAPGIRGQIERIKQRERVEEYLTQLRDDARITIHDDVVGVLVSKIAEKAAEQDSAARTSIPPMPDVSEFTPDQLAMPAVTWRDGSWDLRTFIGKFTENPPFRRPDLSDPDALAEFVEGTLTQQLLEADAISMGLDRTREFEDRITDLQEKLMADKMRLEVILSDIALDTLEAEAYYEAHLDEYTVPASYEVREVLLKTRAEAEDALSRVRAGANIESLARNLTTRTFAQKNGGDIGMISPRRFPELFAVAETTRIGGIAGPVNTSGGWSVFKVVRRDPEVLQPYTDVAVRVQRDALQDKKAQTYESWLEGMRAKAGVSIDEELIRSTVVTGSPADTTVVEGR